VIPVKEIESANLYSQDDARFLLGNGFTAKAAKEHITGACRARELKAAKSLGRWWFTGEAFLAWVQGHILGDPKSLDCVSQLEPTSHPTVQPGSNRKGGRP